MGFGLTISKYLAALVFLFALFVPVAVSAAEFDPLKHPCDEAQSELCEEARTGDEDPLTKDDGVLANGMNILAIVGAIAAIIVMIVNGINFMMAQGDPQKITNARNAVIYAAVGLAVIAVARLIVGFVFSEIQKGG